jgi:hypothetical protein
MSIYLTGDRVGLDDKGADKRFFYFKENEQINK